MIDMLMLEIRIIQCAIDVGRIVRDAATSKRYIRKVKSSPRGANKEERSYRPPTYSYANDYRDIYTYHNEM